MKLSIFPNVNCHPKTPEEKRKCAAIAKKTLPQVVEIKNDDDLINYVTNNIWSSSIFREFATNDNFVSCDFFTLDIDENLTILEAERIINKHNLAALVLPTVSYTEESERFRVIFPLAFPIKNESQYIETFEYLRTLFPMLDPHCSDRGRIYFASTLEAGFFTEGNLLVPVIPAPTIIAKLPSFSDRNVKVSDDIKETIKSIYGQDRKFVPECISFFIKNAKTGLPGKWIWSLNSFCFTLALQGVEDNVILSICEQLAPLPLDDRDLTHIENAIHDGTKERETQAANEL